MFSVFLCGLCDLFVCSGMFGRGRRSAPKVFLKGVQACWSAAPVIMLLYCVNQSHALIDKYMLFIIQPVLSFKYGLLNQ